MQMKKLCVFCGSSSGRGTRFLKMAEEVGSFLCQKNWGLVYGGANIGVMGALANEVLENGGQVLGIIPKTLLKREVGHRELSELIQVDSMHERKQKMYEAADGFLAIAGGMGTLDELFEILTWAQLGEHHKPVYLWNDSGFFEHLLKHLDHAVTEGFISIKDRELLKCIDSLELIAL